MSGNDDLISCRLAASDRHPERREIFLLESLLLQAEIPYYFNYWEDVKSVPNNGCDIDWESYKFQIQIGDTVSERLGLMEISVVFNTEGDPRLLELLDMRGALGFTPEDGRLTRGLTAQQAMNIILQQ